MSSALHEESAECICHLTLPQRQQQHAPNLARHVSFAWVAVECGGGDALRGWSVHVPLELGALTEEIGKKKNMCTTQPLYFFFF